MHVRGSRIPGGETLQTDVCIVGAGPAGLVLAVELARAGVDVTLLEAGTLKGPGKAQRLYKGTSDNIDFHLPPDRDRTRGLGGTSSMWGGRCMPYDRQDFETRDHVPESGWPFSLSDLQPWYERAQTYADCGAFEYAAGQAGLPGDLISGFRGKDVRTDTLERWSPPTHFGKSLGQEVRDAPRIRLVTEAVATDLEHAGGRVTAVLVRSLSGRTFRVAARRTVLAGGGLETARLLLHTAREGVQALGDHSGWLGRGYMCHVGGVVSRIHVTPGRDVVFGYEQDADGVYVRRRITLTGEAQARHRSPNFYALLDRPLVDDASHSSALLSLTFLAKRLFQRQSSGDPGTGTFALYRKHIRNMIFGAPEVLSVLPKFGRQRFLSGRRIPSLLMSSKNNVFYLYFHAEQSPDRESRVVLGDETDAMGMRRIHVQARVSDADLEGMRRGHEVIGAALEQSGAGRLEFLGPDPIELLRACKCTLGHHIGTTRMSADPGKGVVDADGRVHGVANLWVASAGMLPTSSQAHPTLTVLALALRLADHLATGADHR